MTFETLAKRARDRRIEISCHYNNHLWIGVARPLGGSYSEVRYSPVCPIEAMSAAVDAVAERRRR